MKKGLIIGLVALLSLSLVTSGVFAFDFREDTGLGNANMIDAIKSGDFDAFKDAIDQDFFDKIREMYQHKEERKDDKISFEGRNFPDHGEFDEILENSESYEDFEYAIAKLDFVPSCFDQITEENFVDFKAVHQLMHDGDFEGAKVMAEELGIQCPMGGHRGPMHRWDEGA